VVVQVDGCKQRGSVCKNLGEFLSNSSNSKSDTMKHIKSGRKTAKKQQTSKVRSNGDGDERSGDDDPFNNTVTGITISRSQL